MVAGLESFLHYFSAVAESFPTHYRNFKTFISKNQIRDDNNCCCYTTLDH